MTSMISDRASILLPVLLALRSVSASGTINVCGQTYDDAASKCGSNPSCGDLRCPNQYWKEGEVLMKCFAIPFEKCNFGPPAPIVDPAEGGNMVEAEFDPNNTYYCGPVDGGWQLAVENCGPTTACPNGSQDECPSGHTCYGGVNCNYSPSSNMGSNEVYPVNVDGPPTVNVDETTVVDTEAQPPVGAIKGTETAALDEYASEAQITNVGPPSEAVESYISPSNADMAENQSGTAEEPTGVDESVVEVMPESGEMQGPQTVVYEAIDDTKGYCGPLGSKGWATARSMCSRSTMCGPSGSCPEGEMCYGGIHCIGGVGEDLSMSESTTTTTTTTTTTPAPARPEGAAVDLSGRNYCGPDPSVDNQAWATAFESCSVETACSNAHPCPFGQTCYGGIDCLVKQAEATGEVGASEDVSATPNIPASEETEAMSVSSEVMSVAAAESLGDQPPSQPAASPQPQKDELAPHTPVADTNMYCGPDPNIDGAWLTTLVNCSPQTACGPHKPCKTGQFCYANIDCAAKDVYLSQEPEKPPAVIQDINAENSADDAETSEEVIPESTSPAAAKPAVMEDSTFYCGPVGDGGWNKASELCMPCPNGDPNVCGEDMTCYSGVTCSERQPSINVMEAEGERVHIGYCGQSFIDASNKCKERRPCSLDKDCDNWNPVCFAVRCDDGLSGAAISQQAVEGTAMVVEVGSFCGAWYEETQSECANRPPCKTTMDCPGEYQGCFADIQCKFDERSAEYQSYMDKLYALENPSEGANVTNANQNSGAVQSNLRPEDPTFGAREASSTAGLVCPRGFGGISLALLVALVL